MQISRPIPFECASQNIYNSLLPCITFDGWPTTSVWNVNTLKGEAARLVQYATSHVYKQWLYQQQTFFAITTNMSSLKTSAFCPLFPLDIRMELRSFNSWFVGSHNSVRSYSLATYFLPTDSPLQITFTRKYYWYYIWIEEFGKCKHANFLLPLVLTTWNGKVDSLASPWDTTWYPTC